MKISAIEKTSGKVKVKDWLIDCQILLSLFILVPLFHWLIDWLIDWLIITEVRSSKLTLDVDLTDTRTISRDLDRTPRRLKPHTGPALISSRVDALYPLQCQRRGPLAHNHRRIRIAPLNRVRGGITVHLTGQGAGGALDQRDGVLRHRDNGRVEDVNFQVRRLLAADAVGRNAAVDAAGVAGQGAGREGVARRALLEQLTVFPPWRSADRRVGRDIAGQFHFRTGFHGHRAPRGRIVRTAHVACYCDPRLI